MTRKQSAGDTVEARCTRCRAVLNHTIVAMVGDRVARVECNTCRGIHNYHPAREIEPKQRPAAATSRTENKTAPRKAKKDPATADREEWEALQPFMLPERAIRYDMNGKYRVRDVVEHAVFGIGVVKLVVAPNKIEVLFQQGKKLLYASGR